MPNPRLPTHRQIGFGAKDQPETEKKEKQSAKLFISEAPVKEASPSVRKWLTDHPLIKVNGLCKEAGIDRSNFVKLLAAGKEPKPEIKAKIIKIISKYGYQ